MRFLVALLMMLTLTGCSTTAYKQRLAYNNSVVNAYYAQQRELRPLTIQFAKSGGNVTLTNVDNITLEAQLPTLDAPQRERSGAEVAADLGIAVINQTPAIAAGVVGYAMATADKATDRTYIERETLVEAPGAETPAQSVVITD